MAHRRCGAERPAMQPSPQSDSQSDFRSDLAQFIEPGRVHRLLPKPYKIDQLGDILARVGAAPSTK
jgi:hypothetical protein